MKDAPKAAFKASLKASPKSSCSSWKRGLDVSDQVRERITAGDDPEILRGWIARSVTATTAAEIFEAE